MEDLRRLGDRLDVIETALSVALHEPEPEHRGRMLNALGSATAAVRAEHQQAEEAIEEKRSSFRVIQGQRPCVHPQRRRPDGDASAERWTGRTPGRASRSAG
jgi:hypothetical protein